MSAALQHISTLSTPSPALPLPESLTPLQARVVAALAQGATITAAAADTDVHRTTIHQWLRTSEDFRKAVESAKSDYAADLSDRLRELSAAAVKTLEELLTGPDVPAAVRLKTALAVLQRPQYPQTAWVLPESVLTPREQQLAEAYAEMETEENDLTALNTIRRARYGPLPSPPEPAAVVPRNAPCPCGSGEKYKRCCGRNAPPVLAPA